MFEKCDRCYSFSSRFSTKYDYHSGRGWIQKFCLECFLKQTLYNLRKGNFSNIRANSSDEINKLKERLSKIERKIYPPY